MAWINFTDFTGNSATFPGDYLVGYIGVQEQKYPVVALKNGLSAGLFTAQNLLVTENTTIRGNLSVLGSQSVFETIVSVTSALSVVNTGTGPALTVKQTGTEPIALFLDDNNNTFRIDDNFKVSFFNSQATGTYSVAEGNNTVAIGTASHAEGVITTASGNYSHAEGNSTATGRRNNYIAYSSGSKTFTFAPTISANFAYVVPGTTLRGFDNGGEGFDAKYFTITVASRSTITGAIVATADAIGWDSNNNGFLIDNSGTYGHAEGSNNVASGMGSHVENGGNVASGEWSHAEGVGTIASGNTSHAEGAGTIARGAYSHAAGGSAEAAHDRTWIWKGSTNASYLSTTRTDQFVVSAAGGLFLNNAVGINTDSIDNALTVVGNISGNSGLSVNTLTGRNISLVHNPANDGVNSYIQLGEFTTGSTTASAFSGFRFEYNEATNFLTLSSIIGNTITNVLNVEPNRSVTPYTATFTPFTSGGVGIGPGGTIFFPPALSGTIPSSELSSRLLNNRGTIEGVLFFANDGAFNLKQYTLEFAKDAAFTVQKTPIYLKTSGETGSSIVRPVNGAFVNDRIVMPAANATQPWGASGTLIQYPYVAGDSIYYRIGFVYPTAFECMGLSAGYIRIIP